MHKEKRSAANCLHRSTCIDLACNLDSPPSPSMPVSGKEGSESLVRVCLQNTCVLPFQINIFFTGNHIYNWAPVIRRALTSLVGADIHPVSSGILLHHLITNLTVHILSQLLNSSSLLLSCYVRIFSQFG